MAAKLRPRLRLVEEVREGVPRGGGIPRHLVGAVLGVRHRRVGRDGDEADALRQVFLRASDTSKSSPGMGPAMSRVLGAAHLGHNSDGSLQVDDEGAVVADKHDDRALGTPHVLVRDRLARQWLPQSKRRGLGSRGHLAVGERYLAAHHLLHDAPSPLMSNGGSRCASARLPALGILCAFLTFSPTRKMYSLSVSTIARTFRLKTAKPRGWIGGPDRIPIVCVLAGAWAAWRGAVASMGSQPIP